MKRVAICLFAALLLGLPSLASAQAVVFNNIPTPIPPNVPSQGYQCCQTAELGDQIQLEADTPRIAATATVLMSSWAKHSDYPTLDAAGFYHPITLNLYTSEAEARNRTPWRTVTTNFLLKWRPEPDPACAEGKWKAADGVCYSGFAFPITFDLKSLNITLAESFIYGIAFNTNTWGYAPLGASGPYESLNVGFANVGGVPLAPSVGVDVNPDVVFWNTLVASWYTDGGTGGVGVFRPDTGWTKYPVAVQFATVGFTTTAGDCKNGAWRNLVRSDLSPFKNQGECVSYVTTTK